MTFQDILDRYLCCPYDHGDLKDEWRREDGSGMLHCACCGRVWPVVDGIACLLPDGYAPDKAATPPDEARADCLSEMAARDQQAGQYEGLLSPKQTEVEIRTTMRELRIGPGDVVAELGVGTGRLLRYAGRCALVIGCDYSLRSLRELQRKGLPNVVPVQADATLLPLRGESVDAVLSVELFHHIPSQALRRRHLAECRRILRHGGTYLMSGVYNFTLRERLRDVQTIYTREDDHGGADGKTGYHTDNRIFYYNFDHRELRREGERFFTVREVLGFLVDVGFLGKLLGAVLGAYRADRLWQRTGIGLRFGRLLLMRMRKAKRKG